MTRGIIPSFYKQVIEMSVINTELTIEQAKELAKEMDLDVEGIPDDVIIRIVKSMADKLVEKMTAEKPKIVEEDTEIGKVLKVKTLYAKGSTGLSVSVPVCAVKFLSQFNGLAIKHIIEGIDGEFKDHEFKNVQEAVGQYIMDLTEGLLLFTNENEEKVEGYGDPIFETIMGKGPFKKEINNPMFG